MPTPTPSRPAQARVSAKLLHDTEERRVLPRTRGSVSGVVRVEDDCQ